MNAAPTVLRPFLIAPSLYVDLLATLLTCSRHEAACVEAYLRLDRPTLDSLSRSELRREGKVALAEVRLDPGAAQQVALSYGLLRTDAAFSKAEG